MYYGARQGVHGFSPSGFEIHYGELPQKKTGLLILVAVFVALASAFSGMMYKANHISYGLVADFHPIPTAATAPKAAPGEDPATAAATAALPDTPADPIDRSADLQAALDGWLGAHTNRQWAVSFVGLRGDPTKASTRPLERMGLASVYKLLMLYPLVQKLPRAQWDSTFVNANGTSKTVSACVELMLLNSDNPCGEGVANYIGWAKADKALAGLGLTHTYIDRTDDSSAGDVATYIQLMDEGKLFSADDTAYFEKLLAGWVALRERLSSSKMQAPDATLSAIDAKIEHTRTRLLMRHQARTTRWGTLLREIQTGRYRGSSMGWKSMLQDALL